jgi:uncharacterized protein
MGRLLVLIVLIVLAVWLVRRALRRLRQDSPPAIKEGELVRCAHCGVHLPRAEARQADGALYCSEDHARLGKR